MTTAFTAVTLRPDHGPAHSAWFAWGVQIRTPIGNLPWWTVVVANVGFWPTWTFAVGYVAQRVDPQCFRRDDLLMRPRVFERDGGWYQKNLQIHRWKDRLPEAGGVFGGFAKRSVGGAGDTRRLSVFAAETRRAEYAHWAMAAGISLTTIWNPWWALPINGAVAVGSNAPCIAVQRYNRARLLRVLRRLGESSATSGR